MVCAGSLLTEEVWCVQTHYSLKKCGVCRLTIHRRSVVCADSLLTEEVWCVQAHYSLKKSGLFLGIGMDNVVAVPTDDRGCVLPAALDTCMQQDKAQVSIYLPILPLPPGPGTPSGVKSGLCRPRRLWAVCLSIIIIVVVIIIIIIIIIIKNNNNNNDDNNNNNNDDNNNNNDDDDDDDDDGDYDDDNDNNDDDDDDDDNNKKIILFQLDILNCMNTTNIKM